ncbi:helix-turn-helix domain-containing protein [Streptomyces sp. NPDC054884]|uniref:helix-turn-helix domain-containing protein n=1 Tax=Streptomyces sp. ME08-AFT2 TaxID=3028683 RepID=UPI0029BF107E|nr:helix-turn-helix domain-containing protein [Streptomyces sp. ME08-AFT2]MDX3311860.1 helix-turn-helix domain-containing protein [Streptomyces sp. ME08-AFT2]
MALVLTTASVPVGERLAYWQDALGGALASTAVSPRHDGPFDGRVTTGRLGYLRIATIEADAQQVRRTNPRRTDTVPAVDCVAVGVQTAGTATLVQGGRRVFVDEGDLMVYDTARSFSLDFPRRFALRVVHLPRRAVGLPQEELGRVTGTAIPGREGLGALMANFLTSVTVSAPPWAPAAATRLAMGMVDLFGTLADERIRRASARETLPGEHLVLRVRGHIDENLGDPGLSPQTVAAAHHISVRYLHRLFEKEGVTVARLIQQRRLARCARELTRSDASAPTVSAVAQRWGFADPAHFSRVFRAAYGLSPREWRGTRGAMLPTG